MSEVNATGMQNTYAGVCNGGYAMYSRHTIPRIVLHTSAGIHSTRSPTRANSQGLRSGQVDVEACAFCCVETVQNTKQPKLGFHRVLFYCV